MSLKQAYLAAGPSKIIAVDLDDVLTETNTAVCEMHNEIYGTDMVIDDFQHYLYWQNRGWGTPQQTFAKVKHLYESGLMQRSKPVPGAKEGLEALRQLGYKLILVTARSEPQRAGSEEWLTRYFPGVFDEMHFTGAFTQLDKDRGAESVVVKKKRSKAEIAHSINAFLLIDDSIENAMDCATYHTPVPVLLFGAYPWNRHFSSQETEEDLLAFEERIARGIDSKEGEELGRKLEKTWTGESEGMQLPEGVRRVRDWAEVVKVLTELKDASE